jgi:hypothetical protein
MAAQKPQILDPSFRAANGLLQIKAINRKGVADQPDN